MLLRLNLWILFTNLGLLIDTVICVALFNRIDFRLALFYIPPNVGVDSSEIFFNAVEILLVNKNAFGG